MRTRNETSREGGNLAIQAGKTNIVDNGGGSVTVTFRDVADTKNRVEADMQDSERIDVTLDGG